jgi:hypothetical protein
VQRNFECEPESLIANATAGTGPAIGLLLSEGTVTGAILAGAALCKDGHQFRQAVDQQSAGLEGEK